ANLNALIQGTVTTTSYTVATIPYNPFNYTTGTPVLVGVDDEWSDTISLPFCFDFYGNTFTTVILGSNGEISFDLLNANGYNTWPIGAPVPTNTVPDQDNVIMGPWHDIDPSVAGNMYWEVGGTAPCRWLKVSWDQIPMFSCNNLIARHETVLYETTNIIEVYIENKPLCSSWNSGAAIEGLQDGSMTQAIVVPGRNYPTQWTATNDAYRFTPAGAPNYTFTWYDASNMSVVSNNTSIQVCPTTTTSYIAEVVNQTCNGTITVKDTITVSIGTGTVGVTASATTPSCNPSSGSATATATGTGPFTYSWSPGGQTNATATGLAPGTYTVTVYNATGCQATDTVTVVAGVPVSVNASGINTICSGDSAYVTATASGGTPGYNYSWVPGNYTGSAAWVSPATTTTFTVFVTDQAGCTASATGVTVTVNPTPVANYNTNPSTTTPTNNVTFTDQSAVSTGNISGWYWSFGDGDTSQTQNPVHAYALPGTYNVCLVVYAGVCVDSICREYVVEPLDVIVPNVITPNGDGKNDSLIFHNLEFFPNSELKIYDRWGKLVFDSPNYMNDWQGDKVSDGTYYFVLNIPGLADAKKGFVEVLSHK
ncbi:MAG TPA: gliding motility-associated C-terminal domain-containing protein, partial [Bacteroidia bacterium]